MTLLCKRHESNPDDNVKIGKKDNKIFPLQILGKNYVFNSVTYPDKKKLSVNEEVSRFFSLH